MAEEDFELKFTYEKEITDLALNVSMKRVLLKFIVFFCRIKHINFQNKMYYLCL